MAALPKRIVKETERLMAEPQVYPIPLYAWKSSDDVEKQRPGNQCRSP